MLECNLRFIVSLVLHEQYIQIANEVHHTAKKTYRGIYADSVDKLIG